MEPKFLHPGNPATEKQGLDWQFLQDPKQRSIEYLGKANITNSLSVDTYLSEYISCVSRGLDKFEINKSVEMWERKLFLKTY